MASPVDGSHLAGGCCDKSTEFAEAARIGIVRSAAYFAHALTRFETIVLPGSTLPTKELPYDRWIDYSTKCRSCIADATRSACNRFWMRPLISCITTLSDLDDIARLVRGMSDQIYSRWELIVGILKPIVDSVS